VVTKALVCRIAMRAQARGVTSDRSNRASGSNPTSDFALTKRPKHPGCPAAGSLRGGPETQATSADAGGGLGPPDRRYTPAAATWGARALASRRGARDNRERGKRSSNRPRALHSAELGPCCPEKQFTGLLPPTEAARYQALPSSPRKRRRPRKGYAERVVRRHGFLASSHDRTRMPVVPVPDGGLPPHQTSRARVGWKHP